MNHYDRFALDLLHPTQIDYAVDMNEKEKSNTGKIVIAIVLVVGGIFVLLFCGGIVAAVAIPAFVRYQEQAQQQRVDHPPPPTEVPAE